MTRFVVIVVIQRQKRLYDKRAVKHLFAVGGWIIRYYPPAKKCKLGSPWIGPHLIVSLARWAVGVQLHTGWMLVLFALRRLPMRSIIESRFCVKSASRVGRSRRAAGWILEDIGLLWGHQVAVMFQIVCALALESLHGLSPNVIMAYEPWGHIDHDGQGCECLSLDCTGAYVHDLLLAPCGRDSSIVAGEVPTEGARDEDYRTRGVDLSQYCGLADLGTGCPGSVPFVSHRPGAYGRLLLAVHVRWKTGLLVTSDWLHPVTWGGGAGERLRQSQRGAWLKSAD